ncbi:MAG: hypothetical protein HY555_00755 [Euryarchaeota archaeon]|nr:hypothetical protein [Euryarchaeota archaeon]
MDLRKIMPLPVMLGPLGDLILERVLALLAAPVVNPEMIWFVIPLAVITLLMTLYFGLHPGEELGWNTAVGNTVALLFVSIDLMRYIYHSTVPPSFENYLLQPVHSLIVAGVALEALLLMLANFLHFLPRRVAFFISSPLPVNLTAYVVMAIVYTDVPVDRITIFAAVALFIMLLILLTFIQVLERAAIGRVGHVMAEEKKLMEERLEKEAEAKGARTAEGAGNPGEKTGGEEEPKGG